MFTNNWDSVDYTCDILDKKGSVLNYVRNMFSRTNEMFEYSGLPDTIPADMLELHLQYNGHICFTEVSGKLYALCGNFGGAPDPYYRPTLYVVANPALGLSASLSIVNYLPPYRKQDTQGKCVIVKNDTNLTGLLPMCSRYATEITENDISIRCAQINSRQQTLISGSTDSEVASAQIYLKNLEEGRIVSVQEKPFLDGINAQNVSVQASNNIIQLIELQQYLKASWFNDIGLNANFNMKREYMSEEELQESTDILLPLIDDMLRCRKEAIDVVNSTYGTSISVKKNSAWNNKQIEVDTAQEIGRAEAKGGDNSAADNTGERV